MIPCEDDITHWENLADSAERMAAHEREIGLDISAPGCSPGDRKARTYREVAEALRREMQTGLPHCSTCMRPRRTCTCTKKRATR